MSGRAEDQDYVLLQFVNGSFVKRDLQYFMDRGVTFAGWDRGVHTSTDMFDLAPSVNFSHIQPWSYTNLLYINNDEEKHYAVDNNPAVLPASDPDEYSVHWDDGFTTHGVVRLTCF